MSDTGPTDRDLRIAALHTASAVHDRSGVLGSSADADATVVAAEKFLKFLMDGEDSS